MPRLAVHPRLLHSGRAAEALLACLVVALAGCGFTPERAVLQEVRRFGQAWAQTPVDWSSVEVLQSVELAGHAFVLVGFARAEESGQRSWCVFVYEAARTRFGWRAGGGGGGCGPGAGDGPVGTDDLPGAERGTPMWIGSGQNSSRNADAWSRVDGMVHDGAIVRAEVVWDDGLIQEVDLVHGSVLAVRQGAHRYAEVRGLDAEGEVVHVHERAEVAPGKQEP